MVEFNRVRVQIDKDVPAQDSDRYASVYVSRQNLESDISCADRDRKT